MNVYDGYEVNKLIQSKTLNFSARINTYNLTEYDLEKISYEIRNDLRNSISTRIIENNTKERSDNFSKTFELSVVVLSPEELGELLQNAYIEGRKQHVNYLPESLQ